MFVCNNIKISNVEYHFHMSDKRKLLNKKHSRPKIRIFSHNTSPHTKNHVSTLPTPRDHHHTEQQPSLLQKIKKKNQSLATTLFCTRTRNRDQFTSTVKDHSRDPYHSRGKSTVKNSRLIDKNLFRKGQTFVTHQFQQIYSEEEGSSFSKQRKVRVQESDIIQRNLNGRFQTVVNQRIHGENQQHLGIQSCLGYLVCIKKVSLKHYSDSIIRQLRAYNQINRHQNILSLYQVLIDQGNQVFVKQSYTGLVDRNTDIPQLLKDIQCALKYLQSRQVYMDYLEPCDVRECFGIWKLANLSKSLQRGREVVPIQANISNLEQILVNISARSSRSH